LVACAPTQVVEDNVTAGPPVEKIVFGAMFPMTGDGAAYGEPLSRQLQLAVDELNAAGGIDGKQVEIKLEDSKCNPKDGATAAQKLVDVDKVKVIFGGACSGETLGAAPIVEQAKVVMIAPSATSPKITDAGDYVFRTAPSDAYAGEVAAEKALALGYKTAAVINENSDYAQGLKESFTASFEAMDGKVVASESFNPEETDFKTQIMKVAREKPDVIYVAPQTPAKGVLLIKQLRELGVKQPLMTAEVLIGRDVVKEHASDIDGLIGVEAKFDENGPIASKIFEAYRAKYGEPPFPFFQAAVRDAFYLVVDAVKAHGYDADAIKTSLYGTKDWEGAIGKLSLDENGEPILEFSVKQVKDGQLVELN
ncbi:ABC transporter substrate-binding protein, partial [Candidatus Woesearchaeota archaeon]|nr:ABC transporter substrate-binding protein [Candidatus Woesearchaeota archaeon]